MQLKRSYLLRKNGDMVLKGCICAHTEGLWAEKIRWILVSRPGDVIPDCGTSLPSVRCDLHSYKRHRLREALTERRGIDDHQDNSGKLKENGFHPRTRH
jgi:hypothetical protein